ncbi:AraC family transcriptional regulator [Vibrio sp. McD22-P3]|uniref:AraC family transcriptional regulator n=1 Tax=Vibrio sp. McD22-P3 TaxID=2724880 RepID=UPI001F402F4B|nr:helix-turn-helix domain-containing protein [Vibrio sp. McD22-P3]MCF4172985.1 helix-turn-helix domain-containing protein [Vibrio sp. McD22-P3]
MENLKIARSTIFYPVYQALYDFNVNVAAKLNYSRVNQDTSSSDDSWVLIDELVAILQELPHEKRLDILIQASKAFDISLITDELNEENRPSTLGQALNVLLPKIPYITSQAKTWLSYGKDRKWYLCHDSGYSNKSIGKADFDIYRNLQLISFCKLYLGVDWEPDFIWVTGKISHSLIQSRLKIQVIDGHSFSGFSIPLSEEIEPTSDDSDWSLSKSISLVLDNYLLVENMSIHSFSRLIGMSSRTLQRRLHSEKVSFRDLLLDSRLNHAIKLYNATPILNNEDIAFRCGYTDASNFRRAFKKRFGVSFKHYINDKS